MVGTAGSETLRQLRDRAILLIVKANAVLGSLLAIGMLAMALAAVNPAARPDGATELSSVISLK